MCLAINAQGQAGYRSIPGAPKRGSHIAGELSSGGGRIPRADDGHYGFGGRIEFAERCQDRRRGIECLQQGRVSGVAACDYLCALLPRPVQLMLDIGDIRGERVHGLCGSSGSTPVDHPALRPLI